MLIISLILIIGGYYWAFTLKASMVINMMLFILLIVVVGTYMFFWGGFQKLLHLLKLNKRVFYKNSNLVSTSLLSHRAKTMATTMATIAILVAIGTTAISFGYTLFQTSEKTTYSENTFDLYFYSNDKDLIDDVRAVIEKHDSTITDEIHFERYVMQPKVTNHPESHSYLLDSESYFGVYSESQYNMIADVSKDDNEHIIVEKGNATIIYNYYRVEWDCQKSKFVFSDRELNLNTIEGNEYSFGRMLIAVLDDEDFDALLKNGDISTKINESEYWPLTGINYTKALTSADIAEELDKVLEGRTGSNRISYYTYNELLSLFGLLCFVGFFMCAIFILMTASMLYFKQVTIATEEKLQYSMLKKIGLDSSMEGKIIRKRLLPIFFIPLLIGIMHSVFAMKAADTLIFSTMIPVANSYLNVLATSGVMYLAYAAVYIVFYFITKGQYKRMIR
jgi:putative ABC transport system permease protein